MNILDKIILKLYLWRFPEKPFEQNPTEPIPNVTENKFEIRTINGVCWVPERAFLNKWITSDFRSRGGLKNAVGREPSWLVWALVHIGAIFIFSLAWFFYPMI